MRSRGPELLGPLALVVLAGLVIHAGAVARPFFADDYLFLDLVSRHPGLAALLTPDPIGNFFRPLSRAGYFALLAPLTGRSSAGFHLVNLGLFALTLVVFARLVWRALGGGASAAAPGPQAALAAHAAPAERAARAGAITGTAYLALHYAFDVPLAWVSGSQDLLALVFALGALLLALEGRAWWGAAALGCALLCKESVAPAALVAAPLAYAVVGSWRVALRRAAPLGLVTLAWGVLWVWLRSRGTGAHAAIAATPADALAALVHGGQVALGLELAHGKPGAIGGASWAALLLAALGVLWAARRASGARRGAHGGSGTRGAGHGAGRGGARAGAATNRRAVVAGLLWFALGALATAPVAPIWSAYFHSFALGGVALALGGLVGPRRPWVAAAALIALSGMSAQARGIELFAAKENRWIAVSHVNRAYFDRGARLLTRLTLELKGARPSVPPRSTFVFSGVPSFTGFQVADGPYVRFAYHDTTLRSEFLSAFSRRDALRGPVFFFSEYDGHLHDRSDGYMYALLGTVLVVGDHLPQARDAFATSVEREPEARKLTQLWLDWLAAPGSRRATTEAAATAALAGIQALVARGDSAAAFDRLVSATLQYPTDARLHGLAADMLATAQPQNSYTVFQAFAARTLEPDDPRAWRRWALVVSGLGDEAAGLRAIDEWKKKVGPAASSDVALTELERALRAHRPVGGIVAAALRGP